MHIDATCLFPCVVDLVTVNVYFGNRYARTQAALPHLPNLYFSDWEEVPAYNLLSVVFFDAHILPRVTDFSLNPFVFDLVLS
jgi:hypothetical protein